MSRDPGRAAGIEFVPSPDDHDGSEQLTSPTRELLHRSRRLMAAAAFAGLVALVVVRGVTGGGGSAPGARTTASASARTAAAPAPAIAAARTPTPRTSFVVLGEPRIALRHEMNVVIYRTPGSPALPTPGPVCSPGIVCRTSDMLPPQALRALRTRFPSIIVDSTTTDLTGPTAHRLLLRTRTIVAHDPSQAVVITIAPIQPQDRSQVAAGAAGSGSSTSATVADRPWTVTVTVHNPETRDADTVTADDLAADARLLAS